MGDEVYIVARRLLPAVAKELGFKDYKELAVLQVKTGRPQSQASFY